MIKDLKGIELAGISCCIPRRKIFNKNIKNHKNISRTIEAIGIESRPIAGRDTCSSDLILKSAEHIIKKLKWNSREIDVLILVTQTPDYLTPATSGILQNKLNMKKTSLVFDINLGCSGYTHGLIAISSLMKSLNLEKGLLAVGDVTTKLVNQDDKIANLLFGDAGSVTAIKNNKKSKQRIYFNYFSDGEGFEDIIVPSHSLSGRNKISKIQMLKKTDNKKNTRSNVNINLNGPNIFSFAINKVPKIIKELSRNIKNIKYCYLHQANKMIQDNLANQINDNDKRFIFPSTLRKYGNTSSASIPITICSNYKNKKFNKLSLLCGFGVGLSISAVVVDLKKTKVFNIIKL